MYSVIAHLSWLGGQWSTRQVDIDAHTSLLMLGPLTMTAHIIACVYQFAPLEEQPQMNEFKVVNGGKSLGTGAGTFEPAHILLLVNAGARA